MNTESITLTTALTHRDTFLNNKTKLESKFPLDEDSINGAIYGSDLLRINGIHKYKLQGFHYQITKESPSLYYIKCFQEDEDGELILNEEAATHQPDELSALVWAIENI